MKGNRLTHTLRGYGDDISGITDHSIGDFEIGGTRTLENIDAWRDVGRDAMHCVSTAERVPPPVTTMYKRIPPPSTKMHETITTPFAWQPRFHDHIIRDTESFDRIQHYIANNQTNRKNDKSYEGK